MLLRRTEAFRSGFASMRDPIAQAAIVRRLERLKLGNPGDVKPVGDGISEMRVDVGAGWRVYYVQRGAELIILLCVGSKSKQDRDIIIAKRLAKETKDGHDEQRS